MFDDDRQTVVHVFGEELLIHSHCEGTINRAELKDSYFCACYRCGTFFFPEEIKRWTERDSAICPHCGGISVLPDVAHLPLTPGYLAEMKKRFCREK